MMIRKAKMINDIATKFFIMMLPTIEGEPGY